MKQLLLLSIFLLNLILFGASFEDVEIPSKLMGKTFKARVILPDSYDGKKRFAQIYLLHGAGGDHANWHTKVKETEAYCDKYQRIIICPTAGRTSWYNNHNKSEDYIIKELIPHIDKKYKTKNNRWLTGLSMGGYGAIRLGFKYPKLFAAYGGQSPCITPSKWPKNWTIAQSMGTDITNKKQDHFSEMMLKKMKKDNRPFALLCGKQDFFFKENQWALEQLKKHKIKVHYEEMNGAHNWNFWAKSLPKHLEYFAKKGAKK